MDVKKAAKKYIHHRNLFVRGQLELSVIMSLINTGMLFGLFLKTVLDIPTSYVVYIIQCGLLCLSHNWRELFMNVFESLWTRHI